MSENLPVVSDTFEENHIEDEYQLETAQKPRRSLVYRVGCGLLLVIWFTLLLSPCALLYLASNGEIRIWHSDIPEPHAHPRLLIELITEVDYRGLRLVQSSIVGDLSTDNAVCVQTDVSYFLWQSDGENQDVSFCDCYMRDNEITPWTMTETFTDVCPARSP